MRAIHIVLDTPSNRELRMYTLVADKELGSFYIKALHAGYTLRATVLDRQRMAMVVRFPDDTEHNLDTVYMDRDDSVLCYLLDARNVIKEDMNR